MTGNHLDFNQVQTSVGKGGFYLELQWLFCWPGMQ